MKLRLSYIGINTDGPVPILTLENGMTVEATFNMLVVAFNETDLLRRSLSAALLDSQLKEEENPSRSTIDPDNLQ